MLRALGEPSKGSKDCVPVVSSRDVAALLRGTSQLLVSKRNNSWIASRKKHAPPTGEQRLCRAHAEDMAGRSPARVSWTTNGQARREGWKQLCLMFEILSMTERTALGELFIVSAPTIAPSCTTWLNLLNFSASPRITKTGRWICDLFKSPGPNTTSAPKAALRLSAAEAFEEVLLLHVEHVCPTVQQQSIPKDV